MGDIPIIELDRTIPPTFVNPLDPTEPSIELTICYALHFSGPGDGILWYSQGDSNSYKHPSGGGIEGISSSEFPAYTRNGTVLAFDPTAGSLRLLDFRELVEQNGIVDGATLKDYLQANNLTYYQNLPTITGGGAVHLTEAEMMMLNSVRTYLVIINSDDSSLRLLSINLPAGRGFTHNDLTVLADLYNVAENQISVVITDPGRLNYFLSGGQTYPLNFGEQASTTCFQHGNAR